MLKVKDLSKLLSVMDPELPVWFYYKDGPSRSVYYPVRTVEEGPMGAGDIKRCVLSRA